MNWRRRIVLASATACAADALRLPAFAQARDDIPVVGALQLGSAAPSAGWVETVRHGLRQHGLVDGQNVRLVIRYADDDAQRLAGLAAELAGLGCRVIITQGTTSVRAAHTGAPEVPIVMAPSGDPVEAGFARSLARPGGKITGIAIFGSEVIGKAVQILKEAVPTASNFAALLQAANPANARWRVAFADAGNVLGIRIHVREIASPADIAAAFDWAAGLKVDGVCLNADPMFNANIDAIVRLTLAHRLPAISGGTGPGARAGILLTYAQGFDAVLNRAGYYVAEILRGADPGVLPIEQSSTFRLIINLKTAKAIGLTLPPSILARADEVIE